MGARDEAVAQGVYEAFMEVLTSWANCPVSRDDLLAAVTEGVRQAFAKVLGKTI